MRWTTNLPVLGGGATFKDRIAEKVLCLWDIGKTKIGVQIALTCGTDVCLLHSFLSTTDDELLLVVLACQPTSAEGAC